MTLEQLSEATGISASQLSRFETGERKPRIEDAVKISRALDVKISDIFPEVIMPPITDTAIEDLIEAVRRSYVFLGLDEDAAGDLLKIVLSRASRKRETAEHDAAIAAAREKLAK